MKTNPITIAIPYHKNLPYLKEAVDSVARQTLLPAQLIIIDNSEDEQAKVLLNNFPCATRYIRSAPNLGLAAYFNQCLDAAQTPCCTILHSDDLLLSHYVETMTDAIARYPASAGLFCETQAIDRHGHRYFSFKDWSKQYLWPQRLPEVTIKEENGLAALLRANFIMCPTVCYNLPVLNHRRFDPAWEVILDLELYGRLLLEGETLTGIHKILYACRRHPAATTTINEKNFTMFSEGTRCIQTLALKAGQKGWYRAKSIGQRKIIYHLYVGFRILRNLRLSNIKASLSFLRRYIRESH